MFKLGWGIALVCAAAAIAIGCGDDSKPGATSAPPVTGSDAGATGAGGEAPETAVALPTRTPEEYCSARAELGEDWCDYIDHCCSEADRADLYFLPGACADGHDDPTMCLMHVKDLQSKGVVFDGTAVDDCIAALAKLFPTAPVTCDGLELSRWTGHDRSLHGFNQIPACRRMLLGTKLQGGPCDYQNECSPGFVCSEPDQDISQPTVCLPEGGLGAACITDSQCQSDLFCVGLTGRHCDRQAGLGASCLYSSECQPGLSCSLRDRCATVVGVGQGCDETHACGLNLGCNLGTNTCVPIPKVGEICESSCDGRCDNGTCVNTCGGTLL